MDDPLARGRFRTAAARRQKVQSPAIFLTALNEIRREAHLILTRAFFHPAG